MDSATRAEAQSVRRMYGYGLSTTAIARRSGQTQKVVRAYLRFAFSEPLETRFLWTAEWREQARAAAVKTERYWHAKRTAARTPSAKALVLSQYRDHLEEQELRV